MNALVNMVAPMRCISQLTRSDGSEAPVGMPPLDVIRAATQVETDVLGLQDRGTLAAGKLADFIPTGRRCSAVSGRKRCRSR